MNLFVFGSLAVGSHSQAGNISLRDACCDTFGCCWRWWFLPHRMTMKQWWHLFVANRFATFGCCLHFWLLFTLLADCLVFTLLADCLVFTLLADCLVFTLLADCLVFTLLAAALVGLPHRMTMNQWQHLILFVANWP